MPQEKKKDVPVILNLNIYNAYHEQAEASGMSDPRFFHDLIFERIRDDDFISYLCMYFTRSMVRGSRAWFGGARPKPYRPEMGNLMFSKRVHIKITHDEYEEIAGIESAMGCPLNHCFAFIIVKSYFYEKRREPECGLLG